MVVNGYYEIDGVTFVDFETTWFSNCINEFLYLYNDNEYMLDDLKKLWEKFKDKNKPYVIYIFGNGDGLTMGIFSRENNLILYDGEKIPKREHISNFENWVNENFEISENVKLIEILLNNATLCANGW